MQRGVAGVIILRDAADKPPGRRSRDIPRSLPGRAQYMVPARIDGLAGFAEESGAVIGVRTHIRRRFEVLQVRSVELRGQRAEARGQIQLVSQLHIDTAL